MESYWLCGFMLCTELSSSGRCLAVSWSMCGACSCVLVIPGRSLAVVWLGSSALIQA